jgi:fatty-acyl-CoA synthase
MAGANLVETVRERARRVRTAAHLARRSGLFSHVTAGGLVAAAQAIVGRSYGPSRIFRLHAANSPDKVAVLWRDRSVTFRELDGRMDRAARGLLQRRVGRNDRVVVMMRNRPEFLEVHVGAARIGAAGVSVSWRSTGPELAYLVRHSGAKAIIFDADLWPVVEEAKRELPGLSAGDLVSVGGAVPNVACSRYEEDFLPPGGPIPEDTTKGSESDSSLVIYTSGTTGNPKGAVRKFSKGALYAFLHFIAETPMRADDVHLVTCPLYHSTAFAFFSMSALLGGRTVLMDDSKPEQFLELVERHRVTTTAVVPTMLHRVMSLEPSIRTKYDTHRLRAIFCGGAPLSAPLATRVLDHFGDVLFNFYGATETGLVTLAKPDDLREAPGTIGRAVPGNAIRLLDEKGSEVGVGCVGELYVRNEMLVAGYHGDPESTRASMRNGFFSVGDLARRDRKGRYFIEGRKRDMIISGGVNVYPAEVESVLQAHPDVIDAAVVGATDAEWGERVRAFVQLRPGSTLDQEGTRSWCRERLSGPKVPRDVVFVSDLPRNAMGKVLKRELV